jgi:hypothetical protein
VPGEHKKKYLGIEKNIHVRIGKGGGFGTNFAP